MDFDRVITQKILEKSMQTGATQWWGQELNLEDRKSVQAAVSLYECKHVVWAETEEIQVQAEAIWVWRQRFEGQY